MTVDGALRREEVTRIRHSSTSMGRKRSLPEATESIVSRYSPEGEEKFPKGSLECGGQSPLCYGSNVTYKKLRQESKSFRY